MSGTLNQNAAMGSILGSWLGHPVSPLAGALMGQGGAGTAQMPAVPTPGQSFTPPLASMLAPNAMALQRGNPSLPWYAVPGIFGPPPAPPTPPPTPAGAGNMAPPGVAQIGVQPNGYLGQLNQPNIYQMDVGLNPGMVRS